MGRTKGIFRQLADRMSLEGEALPGQTVTELLDDSRVLIENHRGIVHYSPEAVTVLTGFGELSVSGEGLKLTHMTRQVLILSGTVTEITPCRRETP